MRAGAPAIGETVSTPSTSAIDVPTSGEIGEKPSALATTRSPAKVWSSASPTDLVADEAKTAAKTTRATPIIRAAEVVAVRLGLRSVFSRASRPVTPRRASIGRPTNDASGLMIDPASIATPMKSRIRPRPSSGSAEPNEPVAKRPPAIAAAPRRTRPRAIQMRRRVVPGSASAVSCRASSGVTRVARSAGTTDDPMVETMPTINGAMMAAAGITVPDCGSSKPIALKSPVTSSTNPRPATMPTIEAIRPSSERLDDDGGEDLAGGGAERPQHPELAGALGDGDRERVEDQEGPDEDGDPGEDQQGGGQEAEAVLDVRRLLGGVLGAGLRLRRRRQGLRRSAARARPGRRPRRPATAMSSNSPGLPVIACASGTVKTAMLAPPSGTPEPKRPMPLSV